MRRASSRILALALTLTLLFLPASAFAWSNGPSYGTGFGTHDWIMYKANVIASGRGATWVNPTTAMSATDDPDMVLHDTYYHVYDIWGSAYGNSPVKVAENYTNAVNSLRAGDSAAASYYVGLLSHYYSDTCNPLHTDQSTEEESMHSSYESGVDDTTTGTESLPGWIGDDGYSHVTNPTALTQNAAAIAHVNYTALVSGYRSGGLTAVQSITQPRLNQSVNDLADIIKSIQDDAFPFVPVPNAIYRFYNRHNGTHFYTPNVAEAQNVITNLSGTYTYEGVSYLADPAKNTQPLYRFYNRVSQSHFYTASDSEANNVMTRLGAVYTYEGRTYSVCPTAATGGTPIYRFYNKQNGSHFYTASASERDTVMARWPKIYQFEGTAFWIRP